MSFKYYYSSSDSDSGMDFTPSSCEDDILGEDVLIQRFSSSAGESFVGIAVDVDDVAGDSFIPEQLVESVPPNIQYVRADSRAIRPQEIRHHADMALEVVLSSPQEQLPSSSLNLTTTEQPDADSPINDATVATIHVLAEAKTINADSAAKAVDVIIADGESERDESHPLVSSSPDDDQLLETYNNITMSYAQKHKLVYASPAKAIKDLAASLGGAVLGEFTKSHQQREQVMAQVDKVLNHQQQALDRLTVIQKQAYTLATKTFELYEDPIPRMFVVLPKCSGSLDRVTPSKNAFRLYFLCECYRHGVAQRPSDKSPKHVHFASHNGYDLVRPMEFFAKYGSYVVAMLELIKYGAMSKDMTVAPLVTFKAFEGPDGVEDHGIDKTDVRQRLDDMICYIKEQLNLDHGQQDGDGDAFERSASLSAADLRGVQLFLADVKPNHVLGRLFRTTPLDSAHVKWICRYHYLREYSAPTSLLLDVIDLNRGTLDEHRGKVTIVCDYLATAAQFCDALRNHPSILELDLTLQWDASASDIEELCNILVDTCIYILRLDGRAFKHLTQSQDATGWFDSILNLMSTTALQEFSLTDCDLLDYAMTDSSGYSIDGLRTLQIGIGFTHQKPRDMFFQLLKRLSNLINLSLITSNELHVYDLVHRQLRHLPKLETLTLSVPNEKDQTVVLRLGTETAHCERLSCHLSDIIVYRKSLAKVIVPFHRDTLIDQIKELADTYGLQRRQSTLKVAFVQGKEESVVEVEFQNPNQSFSHVPPGQHFRGVGLDMYIRWVDFDALWFTKESSTTIDVQTWHLSSNCIVNFNSSAMSLDDHCKLLESLVTEPPRHMKITCDSQSESMRWFTGCGLAAVSWDKLWNLTLCGEDIGGWTEVLSRFLTREGTRSLQNLEISGIRPAPEDIGGCDTWIVPMVSKSLKSLTLKGLELDSDRWDHILSSIKFTHLTTLDLTGSSITQEHAETLLKRIPQNTPLCSLKLHNIDWIRSFSASDCDKFIADHRSNSNVQILF
ncbi:hypothetical protein B0O80DRAFT_501260 [Mortierella sp. GBAus27b]|nr:hypothetical protein B0O80DRAFT_501260 [Mortierella sp. GBAus27b]